MLVLWFQRNLFKMVTFRPRFLGLDINKQVDPFFQGIFICKGGQVTVQTGSVVIFMVHF